MEGEQLKNDRLAMGLTQGELGELLGVNWTTISRWERGQMAIPSYLHLAIAFLKLQAEQAGKRTARAKS
jgi:transcriptional regulator with XRE-family HTH domain